MNEDRLSSLLKEFAEPIVATNVPIVPVKSPSRKLRFGLVGLGLAGAVALGLTLIPRRSDAAAWHQIETAISNAKSMIVVEKSVDSAGRSRVFNTTWYQEGRWRTDIFQGLPIAKSFIIRDGRQYIYSPKHQTTTMEPAGPWTGEFGKTSALDYAKSRTDIGEISETRTASVQPHDAVDGKPAYMVVMERPADQYRCEIVVDKETSLPIRSDTTLKYMGAGPETHEIQEYSFDEPIPASQFEPERFGLPVQNLTAQQVALLKEWAPSLSNDEGFDIRNVWQNSEGELFVAYTRPKNSKIEPTPFSKFVIYLRADDITPGQIRGDTSVRDTFLFEGLEFRISVWAPLQKPRTLPSNLVFTSNDQGEFSGNVNSLHVLREISVSTDPAGEKWPPYSTTLVLNDYEEQMAIHLATVRADYYKARRDFAHELPWRRAAYARAHEWLPSMAERRYKAPIERCLKDLGEPKP